MYKDVLRSIDGIDIYPVMSLVIFGLFFTALIAYVIKVDNRHIDHMKDLPLAGGNEKECSTNNSKKS